MHFLFGIPVPTGEQIIVGIELAFLLYPAKRLADAFWRRVTILLQLVTKRARRERNRIIRLHVKSGHKSRFKHCVEGECSIRMLQAPTHSLVPELLEVDL